MIETSSKGDTMVLEIIHHPPVGEYIMIGHGGADCKCSPRKTTTVKQERSRQGHNYTHHYWHNTMKDGK